MLTNSNDTIFTLPNSEAINDDILVSENIEQTLSNKKFKDSNNVEYTIDDIPKLNTTNTFTDKQTINHPTGTGSIHLLQAFEPNLGTGDRYVIYVIGKDDTQEHRACFGYMHSTDNNTDNNNCAAIYMQSWVAQFYNNRVSINKPLNVIDTLNITKTSTSNQTPMYIFNSTMADNTYQSIRIGKNDDTNNCGFLSYYHVADNNSSNHVDLEIRGHQSLLSVSPTQVKVKPKLETNQTNPTDALGNNLKAVIRDFVYPVGAVYISFKPTSPATLFGGSWTQIKDRFLYCANSSNQTNGSSTHSHNLSDNGYAFIGCQDNGTYNTQGSHKVSGFNRYIPGGGQQGGSWSLTATKLGGSTDSVSSMPPYITCYCWQRTA